jgi:hypothetical protein
MLLQQSYMHCHVLFSGFFRKVHGTFEPIARAAGANGHCACCLFCRRRPRKQYCLLQYRPSAYLVRNDKKTVSQRGQDGLHFTTFAPQVLYPDKALRKPPPSDEPGHHVLNGAFAFLASAFAFFAPALAFFASVFAACLRCISTISADEIIFASPWLITVLFAF